MRQPSSHTDDKVSVEYGSIINFGVAKYSARHIFLIDPEGKIVKEHPEVESVVGTFTNFPALSMRVI